MQGASFQHRAENRVIAAFEAGVHSFDISEASTLGDLATRLANLEEQHGEALIAVQITTATPRSIAAPPATGRDDGGAKNLAAISPRQQTAAAA